VPKTRRIARLLALSAVLLVTVAAGRVGAADPALDELWWLGPYFGGMRLTHEPEGPWDGSYSYGDCELPEGEGGCSLPAQVQTATACARNPIGLDRLPYEVFLLRGGGLAAVYESTAVDVGTGGETVTVYTNEPELVGAALSRIHSRSQAGPEPLAPPVYPMPVLRELKRVTVFEGRLGIGAIVKKTGLFPGEVQLRLRIAKLLGPDALAGVPAPTMSVDTVEELRQLAFNAEYDPARTARKHGITLAELRKKVRRVRGLAGFC
jgi:hypothetical protein